jgi:hypothetical protein
MRSPTGAHIVERKFFQSLGGIPSVNCGEDRDFNTLAKQQIGTLPECSELPPGFLYRWSGSGHYHISAYGDDKPGKVSGWQQVEEKTRERVRLGKEPKGSLPIKPVWRDDWVLKMRDVKPETKPQD